MPSNRFSFSSAGPRRLWRVFAVLGLVLGLVAVGGAVQAAPAEAAADNVITLFAPDAPAGAWTAVQWQTPDGAWHTVDGWQGALDTLDDTGLRLKQWTVSSDLADQGPFRWVLYSAQGGSVWGTSDSFDLPGGEGVNLAMTIEVPAAQAAATPAAAPTVAAQVVAPAAVATAEDTRVATDTSTWYFDCNSCGYGLITAFVPDAPLGSAVSVQYQLPNGAWQTVAGWQATLQADENGQQFVQWSVYPENAGQGPFRWVVTRPNGSLWGVSASFNLPAEGVQSILYLLRH